MTPTEQAKAYEPIFYHHKDESWVPVRPAGQSGTTPIGFFGVSRMWLAEGFVEALRKNANRWGRTRIPLLPAGPLLFDQGHPLIPHDKVAVVKPAGDPNDYPDNFAGPFWLGHDENAGSRNEDLVQRRFPYTEKG